PCCPFSTRAPPCTTLFPYTTLFRSGVDLKARGLAQVSINLTDFEQTPIHRVFEMVKREAERYGCAIVGSEIVGLVPKKALEMTADRKSTRLNSSHLVSSYAVFCLKK